MKTIMLTSELKDLLEESQGFCMDLKEIDILKALQQVYDRWKSIAMKTLSVNSKAILLFDEESDDELTEPSPSGPISIIISNVKERGTLSRDPALDALTAQVKPQIVYLLSDIKLGSLSIIGQQPSAKQESKSEKRVIKESLKKKEAKEFQ